MFGKRRGWRSPKEGVLTTANVIVPRSSVEAARSGESPYDLVEGVIDFVNVMFSRGLLKRDEIPKNAVQVFHAVTTSPR